MGKRWRPRQQLRCGESFHDAHGASADWADPVGGRARLIRSGRRSWGRDVGRSREQLEAELQQPSTSSVGEEAEVADAHEATWQQVQQEAAQELIDRQSQQSLLVGMSGVSPAEGDLALFEGDQSSVGDGYAMGVAAEIAQRMFRSAEWWLGIDDPVVAEEGSAPSGEGSWIRKRGEVSMELELVVAEGRLQSVVKLAAKDAAEHLDRQEETGARRDPACVVGSEASGGSHAVDMGMNCL